MNIQRNRIKDRLVALDMKQTELHERARKVRPTLSWSSLQDTIRGNRNPSLDMTGAIAKALETTVGYLVGETDDPAATRGEVSLPEQDIAPLMARLKRLEPAERELVRAIFEEILKLVSGDYTLPERVRQVGQLYDSQSPDRKEEEIRELEGLVAAEEQSENAEQESGRSRPVRRLRGDKKVGGSSDAA